MKSCLYKTKTNSTHMLMSALLTAALLAGCNSGGSPPPSGVFPPTTPPPGGGGPITPGPGVTSVRVGFQRSANFILSAPRVALNDSDKALVAWQEDETSNSSVWANLLSSNVWGSAIAIDTQNATDPQVAIDPNGNAIVTWTQKTTVSSTLWARRYVNGAWSTATRISAAPVTDNTFYAFASHVVMDINGNSLVVWTQDDPANTRSVWFARHDGSTWSTPLRLSSGARNAYEPRVAADTAGNIIAVWTQDTNIHNPANPAGDIIPNIWARHYSAGTWTTAIPLGDASLATNDSATAPYIVMNANGDAALVWKQQKSAISSITAILYRIGVWNNQVNISPAFAPAITLDNNGNAIVLWQSSTATTSSGGTNRYNVTAGWGTPEALGTPNSGVQNLHIDMDGVGNALAIWQENPAASLNPVVKARRYLLSSGWQAATNTNITGQDPALDLNTGGMALVVAKQKVNNGIGLLTAPWALFYRP